MILDIKKVKLLDGSGSTTALIGIAIDITERKHAEQILRSSEEKLRTMFEMSPLGIAQNTMDGRYIEANRALLDMVGYSLEKLNSMSYWELTPQDYETQELNHPRQSRGLIMVSPSKGPVQESPEGDQLFQRLNCS